MSEYGVHYVLSDVDGTQIGPSGLPTAGVTHAIRASRAPVLEVTSRPYSLLRPVVESLGLGDHLCTVDGGATLAKVKTGEIIWSDWFDATEKNAALLAVGGLCNYIHFDSESRQQTPSEVLASLADPRRANEITPGIFATFEKERSSDVARALATVAGIDQLVMSSGGDPAIACFQLVKTGVSKGAGANRMLERMSVGQDVRCLRIGDGDNDIDFFRAAATAHRPDITVAIRNEDTPEELLDIATWVAPSIEEDGFVAALKHFKLID